MAKQKYPQSTKSEGGSVSTSSKIRKSYSHAKLDARIDKRRQDAEARQREYDALPLGKRLDLALFRVGAGKGECKREIARLQKAIAEQKKPQVKTAPLTEEQKAAKAVKRAKDAATAAKR